MTIFRCTLLIGLLLIGRELPVHCDELIYSDTSGMNQNTAYMSTNAAPSALLNIVTSNTFLSETSDNVYATFIGDFANSGPHLISQSFEIGSTVNTVIPLSRKIGLLKKVHLEKNGIDGWLLSTMTCTIDNVQYELSGPRSWLDNFDPAQFSHFGNGYEPEAQEGLDSLPASSVLELRVISTINIFSNTGVFVTSS